MEDDDFEADVDAEDGTKFDFDNTIAEEPLVPPAKPVSRIRNLSFNLVALLLVLVAIINLAMIIWFLLK